MKIIEILKPKRSARGNIGLKRVKPHHVGVTCCGRTLLSIWLGKIAGDLPAIIAMEYYSTGYIVKTYSHTKGKEIRSLGFLMISGGTELA